MLWNGSMLYQFDPFELDLATFEVRADGKACDLEPQVLALWASGKP